MKAFTDFIASLQFIFRPDYWFMLGKYDKQFDKQLRQLAAKHDFAPVNAFDKQTGVVTLGDDLHLWVGNYPYSYLTPLKIKSVVEHKSHKIYFYENHTNHEQSRPSRLTISRLHKKVIADLKKHNVDLW